MDKSQLHVPLVEDKIIENENEVSQPKQKSTFLYNCVPILGTELCERLAYYGISFNLVIYLNTVMGVRTDKAASQVNFFEGMCYMTPLIGAYLADTVLGRYYTILASSMIYFAGMVQLTLSAFLPSLQPASPNDDPTSFQMFFLNFSLAVIAFGTGGIKPVVSVFGADQFDDKNPQDKKEKESFFNWFYFVVNVGSLIACTVVVYLQENSGWALGFAIPTFAMMMAIISFVSGYRNYRHAPTSESPTNRILKVIFAAVYNRLKYRQYSFKALGITNRYMKNQQPDQSIDFMERQNKIKQGLVIRPQDSMALIGNQYKAPPQKGLVQREEEQGQSQQEEPVSEKQEDKQSMQWLNWAMRETLQNIPEEKQANISTRYKYNYRQVQEVRLVLGLIPFFIYMILYWTLYQQMTTFFVLEGQLMNRNLRIFKYDFKVPSASMSLFNTLAIICLIPIYDKVCVPLFKKMNKQPSNLQRIGLGFLIAILAMLYSAGIESWRLIVERKNDTLPEDEQQHLSIFWQAGAYLLVGLSEILSSIGQLEFFYDQSPQAMRSSVSALSLLSTAFGSFLSAWIVSIIQYITSLHGRNGWVPKNLNKGRLDLFFLIIAVCMMVNMVGFAWSASRYKYQDVENLAEQQPRPQEEQQVEQQDTSQALQVPINQRQQTAEDYYGRSIVVQPLTPALPNHFR